MNTPNPRHSSQDSSQELSHNASQGDLQDPSQEQKAERIHRPYFLPGDFEFHKLPPDAHRAIRELIKPAQHDLVYRAPTAIERCAGSSFVFLLLIELLEQFDMGRHMTRRLQGQEKESANDASSREADFRRLLRLMSAKERAGQFLLQVRHFCKKYERPLSFPFLDDCWGTQKS